MATMLLTQALRKRQTLKARIAKAHTNLLLVGALVGSDKKPEKQQYKTVEEYTAEMRASLQTYNDLQKEYFKLVGDINTANLQNTITLNGEKVSLVVAIEMRNNLEWQKDFVRTIHTQAVNMERRILESNTALEEEIQHVTLRNKTDSMATADVLELEEQTRNRLEKANKAIIHDPLSIRLMHEREAAKYTELCDELDTKLNIANATITIGVAAEAS